MKWRPAQATPRAYGTNQPAGMFNSRTVPTTPSVPNRARAPSRQITTRAIATAVCGPRRNTRGVTAVRNAYTARNHNGEKASHIRVWIVSWAVPAATRPIQTRAHMPTNGRTGRASRDMRCPSQAR